MNDLATCPSSSFESLGSPVSETSQGCQESCKPGSVGFLAGDEAKETGVLCPPFTSDGREEAAQDEQYRKLQSTTEYRSLVGSGTTPSYRAPSPAHRDGCGCPPQVERCVHFDGKILCFTGPIDAFELTEHRRRCNPAPYAKFDIGITSAFAPCKGGCGTLFATKPGESLYTGDSEADALAAFFAAEQQLLGGEA